MGYLLQLLDLRDILQNLVADEDVTEHRCTDLLVKDGVKHLRKLRL